MTNVRVVRVVDILLKHTMFRKSDITNRKEYIFIYKTYFAAAIANEVRAP